MRHVPWCPWHGMIKLLCQGNDIHTDLQAKTGCLAHKPSFSFSTAQKIFIYTPQSNSLEGQTKVLPKRHSMSEVWTWPTDFLLWPTTTFARLTKQQALERLGESGATHDSQSASRSGVEAWVARNLNGWDDSDAGLSQA